MQDSRAEKTTEAAVIVSDRGGRALGLGWIITRDALFDNARVMRAFSLLHCGAASSAAS